MTEQAAAYTAPISGRFRVRWWSVPLALLIAFIGSQAVATCLIAILPVSRPMGVVVAVTLYPLFAGLYLLTCLVAKRFWMTWLILLGISVVLFGLAWGIAGWRWPS